MADHHDDELAATTTEGFKVGEKKTLDEYNQLGMLIQFQFIGNIQPSVISQLTIFLSPAIDKDDEAMNRWKASLGLNSGDPIADPNDPRKCIIKSLALQVDGREDVVIDLSSPGSVDSLKDKPFKIKEGSKFHIKVTFQVHHEVLSGLKYLQVVKRKGIRVSKDEEMLGSYAPNTTSKVDYSKECEYLNLVS
jgi:Rho GDP-dissociation inhibitor